MTAGRLRFAVIGSPVGHSRSPAMHMAAYRALGMAHVYEKIETPPEELAARLLSLRDGTFAGLNVTVPLKTRALAMADAADESARRTGAANTLVVRDGAVVAHNTDAPALREELRAGRAPDAFAGRSAVVLGTGGAARAAVAALAEVGIARIVVRARDTANVEPLRAVAPGVAIEAEALRAPARERDDLAAIVQATSCGMTGGPPGDLVADAVAWAEIGSPGDVVAVDVVYTPRETPFLVRASNAGLLARDGLGMLVRQGALAFELWLGVAPPLDVMRRALLDQPA